MTDADRPAGAPADGYPPARRLDLTETLHGRQIADPYRWLEDPDSIETQDWVAAQQDLYAGIAAKWPRTADFADRITDLLRTGDIGLPRFRGRLSFFTRREPDGELPVLYVREDDIEGPANKERVLLDPLVVEPAGTTTLDAWSPSPTGALVAVQLSASGTEDSDLLVLDVTTGKTVDGPIDRCRFSSIAWLPDESGFYYVRREAPATLPDDEAAYHRRVRLRRFDRRPETDVAVFGEGRDKASIFSVDTDSSGRWLVLHSQVGTEHRNEVWLADLHAGHADRPSFVPVITEREAETRAHIGDDGRLYLLTDVDAPRFRLAVADPSKPDVAQWVTLLAEDPEAVLNDVAVLDRAIKPVVVALRGRHALSELSVHDLRSGAQRGRHRLARGRLPSRQAERLR